MSAQAIAAEIEKLHTGPRLVVITGGEPFRQDISALCWLLVDSDYQVQVETNGTLPTPFGMPGDVWVVCSPKTGKVHPGVIRNIVAYKYVLSATDVHTDGLPGHVLDHTAEPRVARPPTEFNRGAIYLQPADLKDEEKNKRNLEAVIQSCMTHGYTLQLQIHKLLNME